MNIRENQGITMVALVITIIVLLIITGISIQGSKEGLGEAAEATEISELNMVQHAILERYTKAQLTKESLPGTDIEINNVKSIINEINSISGQNITLKAENGYKELSVEDLKNLGITQEDDVFIVNYKTGEVINKTLKTTSSGTALYIYSRTTEN